MDKYSKFLEEQLKLKKYTLLPDDEKKIKNQGKAEWITGKITAKKFRKASVKENTRKDILEKIQKSIDDNKPVYLIVAFGGYKHFWNPSYPEVDWAEFFNLRFMLDFVAPILAVHRPGVILDYESEDVILPMIDNFPEEALDKYAKSFKKLIGVFAKNFPDNLKINYVRSQDQCDTEKLLQEVRKRFPEAKKNWQKLPKEEKEYRLHRSPKCILWDGKEDLTGLNEKERQERIEKSKIINELYYEVDFDFRGDYFVGDNHIPLVLSWGLCNENFDNWLTLGSTYASTVDFWSGRGVLEDRGDKIVMRVVSQNQYKEIFGSLKEIDSNIISLGNFKNIEVYKGKLRFN